MKGYKDRPIYAIYNETAFSGVAIYGFEDDYILQGSFYGDKFMPIHKSVLKWSERNKSYYFVHHHQRYYLEWFM